MTVKDLEHLLQSLEINNIDEEKREHTEIVKCKEEIV
jgi:hypothetical protein